MPEIMGYEDFYANCNHMPGADRKLRVGGKVIVPTKGWSARLEEHQRDGTPPINPGMLELDLIVTPPSPGTPVPEVITHQEIEELCMDDPPEYQEVYFYLVDRDGEKRPEKIEVEHLK